MDLKGIMSISGYPGLFKMISQTKNGIIVESLIDKKRMPAYATSKISSLEDIAVYTNTEEVALKDVFKNIFNKENGQKANVNSKSSNDELKKYFEEVLPDFDKERVYVSHIKHILNWYNLLQENNLLIFTEEEKTEEKVEEQN